MDQVIFQSVGKTFRHRPALFNWFGRERSGETAALRDISFTAGPGVLVLLGPNGSGKTTTLKLISTLLLPDEGAVSVGGVDTRKDGEEVRRLVGIAVAAERSFFPRLSARENLDFFAALNEVPRNEREERIVEVLATTGLNDQADTLVMKFSSGMCQRLGLARALLKHPSILLLDEPTRSLDAAATARFWGTIRGLAREETTILLATHNFAEAAAVGDQFLLMGRGELKANGRLSGGMSAETLRGQYFEATGEIDEGVTVE